MQGPPIGIAAGTNGHASTLTALQWIEPANRLSCAIGSRFDPARIGAAEQFALR
jgi:hypothetical protein